MDTQTHIYREIHPPVSSLTVHTGEQVLVHKEITDYITAEISNAEMCLTKPNYLLRYYSNYWKSCPLIWEPISYWHVVTCLKAKIVKPAETANAR
jgi:hypothetical protein